MRAMIYTINFIISWVGVFVITMYIFGSFDLIDFHVCIKDAGQCKIITMDEYNALKEQQ